MARIADLESEARGDGAGSKQSFIKEPKKFYPKSLGNKNEFKVWAQDFARWFRIETDKLHNVLEHAGKAKQPIATDRIPAEWKLQNHYIYPRLKILTPGVLEASNIVRLVSDDSGLEAWRTLLTKFQPKTLATKGVRL